MQTQKKAPPISFQSPILLVDDEEALLRSYRMTLGMEGMENLTTIQDSREVMEFLSENEVDLMVLDISMPHISGEEILTKVSMEYPALPVLVVTGLNDVELAVSCLKKGAKDYLVKPLEPAKFIKSVQNILDMKDLQRENTQLKEGLFTKKVNQPEAFSKIHTISPIMHALFQYAEMVAQTTRPVLIAGESGVGKELIARALHKLSGRPGKFISVNVSGLDDTLFTDTLFGHEKGAFTGAMSKREGLIERASMGTLFLDEIGDLENHSQIRLLRLLQEEEYYPLGADSPKKAKVRILAATHQNLEEAQTKGTFRKDLFFRLSVHHMKIPPLRERFEDLPILVENLLKDAAHSLGKSPPAAPSALLNLLEVHTFPGNIRELQGMVIDAMAQHKGGKLSLETFKKAFLKPDKKIPVSFPSQSGEKTHLLEQLIPEGQPFPSLKESENYIIEAALQRSSGNQTLAAEILGITRQTLHRHLKKKKGL